MNIGGFQVERPIARGGMGEVFEATQLSLGRKVALKVVASERNADRAFVERFRREARAAAAIEHPNILPVYETGETEDGRLYMAMRLVVEGLQAGDSPGGAIEAVREGLESTDDELADLAPPRGDEATLRRAEELVGAERDYLDAVGSVLNNPGSPRIGELVRLEGEADEALGDLDPVAPGLEDSLEGSEPLVAYSESRLSACEQREQQEALASQQQGIQAGMGEQELGFTRQVDALLEPSRPVYDASEQVVLTMFAAADGEEVDSTLNEVTSDIDGVIVNRGDAATSAAAITAPTEETRRVGELLVAYFDAAREQGQAIRNCLTDVGEPDLSDISAACVGALDDTGADGPEREAFTDAYDTLRGRLGLPPVVGEF